MISRTLVGQIEEHSGRLAQEVFAAVRRDPHTAACSHLDDVALREAVHDLFRHLGQWLSTRTDQAVESYYRKIGRERYLQKIPLSQRIGALLLVRSELLRFLRAATLGESGDLPLENQLQFAICEFIEKATDSASIGYEHACEAGLEHKPTARMPVSAGVRWNADVAAAAAELSSMVSRAGEVGEVSG